MTNADILKTYIEAQGYTYQPRESENLVPLMYYFMMDCSQQYFDKFFRGKNKDKKVNGKVVQKRIYKQKSSQYINDWADAYKKFNDAFWDMFNEKETDYIIEKMDSFNKYIEHDLEIAAYSYESICIDLPVKDQEIYAACWLSNILASDAQSCYGLVHIRDKFTKKKLTNPHIDAVMFASREFAKTIYTEYKDKAITEKQFNNIQAAVSVIANKTYQWLVNDEQNDRDMAAPSEDSLEQLKSKYNGNTERTLA